MNFEAWEDLKLQFLARTLHVNRICLSQIYESNEFLCLLKIISSGREKPLNQADNTLIG